jgi:hypothetical protein
LIYLREMNTALDMWIFLTTNLQSTLPENQTAVEMQLRLYKVKEGATLTEMAEHLENFNIMWLEAVDAGCKLDSMVWAS